MQHTPDWVSAEPNDDSDLDSTSEPVFGPEMASEVAVFQPWAVTPLQNTPDPFRRRPAQLHQLADLRIAAALSIYENFRTLAGGWNGPGSGPVTEAAWGAARDVLRRLVRSKPEEAALVLSIFRLVPLSSGGLHLIWRRREWVMTIEIPYDGSTDRDYFGKDGNGFVQGNLANERQFLDAASFLANRLATP